MTDNNNRSTVNPSAAILWASAFVIAALVIMQAGRLPSNTAHAGMTSTQATYSILTANSGRGPDEAPDELLYVIDSYDQVLLVYEIEDAKRTQIPFREGGSLATLFQRAR